MVENEFNEKNPLEAILHSPFYIYLNLDFDFSQIKPFPMRVACMLLFIYFHITSFGQNLFDINGRKITDTSVMSHDKLKLIYIHMLTNGDMIGFKKLTNKPVWFFTKDASKIPALIRSFNYKSYLESRYFHMDLDSLIADKLLDTTYVFSVFGKPDIRQIDKEVQVFDEWIYRKYDVKIQFNDAVAVYWEEIPFTKINLYDFLITSYELGGEYNSTNVSLSVSNFANKTIKYVWFTTVAFNAVKDKIGTKIVKGVGPIEPYGSGKWDFEDVYYSKVLDVVRITSVKIQYMDGSIKLIPSGDIGKIMFLNKDKD